MSDNTKMSKRKHRKKTYWDTYDNFNMLIFMFIVGVIGFIIMIWGYYEFGLFKSILF